MQIGKKRALEMMIVDCKRIYCVFLCASRKGTRPQKARCGCASEPKRVCFYFYEMKDGRNDGLMGVGHARRKERFSPITLGASAVGTVLCPMGAI